GDTLNRKLAAPENRIQQWIKEGLSDEQIIRRAFLVCLAREPSAKKMAQLKSLMSKPTESRRVVIEDLLWSLISSREFMFNH
ncbi:MAG: S-layer protein, partial [Planctomycetota bacterium]|nr:S-layer protein [Planctomycetota bacterium]